MTTPQAIKALIVRHVGTLLGIYYPDNIPSIYIGNPPSNFSCKGLEVNIPTFPQLSRSKVQTRTENWEITFTQYTPTTTINIHTAINILRDSLTPTPEFYFLDRPQNLNLPDDIPILPQCILKWTICESTYLIPR
jgi:hypothetical protein